MVPINQITLNYIVETSIFSKAISVVYRAIQINSNLLNGEKQCPTSAVIYIRLARMKGMLDKYFLKVHH